ncbi:MAG TPA: helicase HerA-like domain-containing protein [Pirellulales bacterium]|nr:helicase HerA-like domain-containing protein [Pirellulales bacterium]
MAAARWPDCLIVLFAVNTMSVQGFNPPDGDQRLMVFCSPTGREVFHSICHAKEIGTPDPFDVQSIHAEIREVFEAMVARATTPPGTPSGRSLLLLGESGSGKTHLMRAFRNYVHASDLGYCGYLQMTTPTHHYGRYILSKLLASLDERYDDPRVTVSGLMCLSTALVDSLGPDYASVIEELRVTHFRSDELTEFVDRLSKDILEGLTPRGDLLGTIRALIYLQRHDSALRAAAHSYLRCEDLPRFDREALGGIVSRTDGSHPLETIETLGYLMWAVHGRPLVLFVDQLEDMYNLEDSKELFRRAIGALNTVAESVPSSIIVIACLEDYYEHLKPSLAQSLVDRIERNPDKMRLESRRTEPEIIDLVATRLAVLYEGAGVEIDGRDPIFPIPAAELRERRNLRTRDVLDWCRRFQEQFRSGKKTGEPEESVSADLGIAELEQHWQTFQAEGKWTVPTDEDVLAAILARALNHGCQETANGRLLRAAADGRFVEVTPIGVGRRSAAIVIGICNKRPQGNGLARQVEELDERAAGRSRFMVRSMEFPSNPRAQIATVLGDYITRGGRRTVIEDSQWRAMLAYDDFHRAHQTDAAFAHWLVREKPLTRLRPLREILANGSGPTDAPAPTSPAKDPLPTTADGERPVAAPPQRPRQQAQAVRLGKSTGLNEEPVEMQGDEVTRHAAFLGGSGSGKTTVALNLIEQLLERGVPAILVDRKGDLCGYADVDWWKKSAEGDEYDLRKRALRERVAARLYTPGNARGRGLRLSVVPPGLSHEKDFESLASAAGAALASMAGFGESRHGAQRAILIHAVKQLAQLRPNRESGIAELVELIDSEDPALVNAIGRLDTKLFKRIVQELETLRLTRGHLFDAAAERLDFDGLLTTGADGRTPLTIVSTKFLGNTLDVQFWIAQFLNELRRWAGAHPTPTLQALLLLDEADIYLPARSQPASKAPLEDLLKRARSAGIGLLLATQSPGDFDYKCRENVRAWFLGRIKEDTAIGKLKPMLDGARGDPAAKLPGQQPGEFQLVRDGHVTSLQADRSLLKTEQLADEAILKLARATVDVGRV